MSDHNKYQGLRDYTGRRAQNVIGKRKLIINKHITMLYKVQWKGSQQATWQPLRQLKKVKQIMHQVDIYNKCLKKDHLRQTMIKFKNRNNKSKSQAQSSLSSKIEEEQSSEQIQKQKARKSTNKSKNVVKSLLGRQISNIQSQIKQKQRLMQQLMGIQKKSQPKQKVSKHKPKITQQKSKITQQKSQKITKQNLQRIAQSKQQKARQQRAIQQKTKQQNQLKGRQQKDQTTKQKFKTLSATGSMPKLQGNPNKKQKKQFFDQQIQQILIQSSQSKSNQINYQQIFQQQSQTKIQNKQPSLQIQIKSMIKGKHQFWYDILMNGQNKIISRNQFVSSYPNQLICYYQTKIDFTNLKYNDQLA